MGWKPQNCDDMIQRRILYFTILIGSLAFFWAYQMWLSGLLLTVVVFLPWLSLLLSLPAIFSCKVQLQCPSAVTVGSETIISWEARCWFPLPEIRGSYKAQWILDGKKKRMVLGKKLPTAHCGAIKINRCRIRICDYLGLFCFPVEKKQDRLLLVRPVPVKPKDVPDLSRFAASIARPKAGGGYSENHELRLYRPGDSLRQIHWKLSAKTNKLMIREPMEPIAGAAMLTMTLSGTRKTMDEKLGILLWMSRYLAQQQIKHRIFCVTGSGVKQMLVSNETEADAAVDEILQCKMLQVESQAVYPKAVWRYHIGGDGNG